MTDDGIDATGGRAMKDTLPQIRATFLPFGILGPLLTSPLRDVIDVEIAVSFDASRHAKHPAEFADRLARRRTAFRHQDTGHVIYRAGVEHLVNKFRVVLACIIDKLIV